MILRGFAGCEKLCEGHFSFSRPVLSTAQPPLRGRRSKAKATAPNVKHGRWQIHDGLVGMARCTVRFCPWRTAAAPPARLQQPV